MSMLSRASRARLFDLRNQAIDAHNAQLRAENEINALMGIPPIGRETMILRDLTTDFIGDCMTMPDYIRRVRTEQARLSADGEAIP